MVNYCCVYGCGRNGKTSKHLQFYGIPKDSPRLELWLQAIGRKDLLDKNLNRLSYRVCSRHFAPINIKNKHLCSDAVPTLCLPNNECDDIKEEIENVHTDIVCNSCKNPVIGYRYKCITCLDYDLCSKCEMLEVHPEHYMLRIPKPSNYKKADEIIKKIQNHVTIEHVSVNMPEDSSDDDVPIKEFVKQYDSGIDLSEDIKTKIRNEVTRVLNINDTDGKKLKRKKEQKKKEVTKNKNVTMDKSCGTEDLDEIMPEVVFADVNDISSGQMLDVKDEISSDMAPIEVPAIDQPMTDLNLTEADFILTSLNG